MLVSPLENARTSLMAAPRASTLMPSKSVLDTHRLPSAVAQAYRSTLPWFTDARLVTLLSASPKVLPDQSLSNP